MTPPSLRSQFQTWIVCCARCGQDHKEIMFYLFQTPVKVEVPAEAPDWLFNPRKVEFQYWAWCPIMREPILLYQDGEEKKIS